MWKDQQQEVGKEICLQEAVNKELSMQFFGVESIINPAVRWSRPVPTVHLSFHPSIHPSMHSSIHHYSFFPSLPAASSPTFFVLQSILTPTAHRLAAPKDLQ